MYRKISYQTKLAARNDNWFQECYIVSKVVRKLPTLQWMDTYRHMATNAHPIDNSLRSFHAIHKDLYHLNFLTWNKLQLIGYLVLGMWPVIAKLSLPTAKHSKFNSLCKTLRLSTWHEHGSAKLSHLLPYNRACWQASSSYINSTCVGVKTDSSMESFSMF